MKEYKVYGIGNSLLDYEYKVNDKVLRLLNLEKGCMYLNSYEEYFKIHNTIKDIRPPEKILPGGSVANSIYAMAQFGNQVCFSGKVSDDETGKNFISCLENSGVKSFIGVNEKNKSGECLVLVTPDFERTMCTFLGSSEYLESKDINKKYFESSEYILMEGYLVTSNANLDICEFCFEQAKRKEIKTIFTLSDPNVVKGFRENILNLLKNKVTILFCNEDEAKNFAETDSINDAYKYLKGFSKNFIITRGEKGSVYYDGLELKEVPTEKVLPKDFTGAGDMFLGSFMHSICRGESFFNATKFANFCAGKIIQIYGAKFNSSNEYQNLINH